jgi:outer membrane beta-barrel protein
MRFRLLIPGLILAVAAQVAAAQELPGLDLRAPPKRDEKAAARPEKPSEPAPLSLQPEPVSPQEKKAAEPSRGGAIFGERDVALGDRVKAVQRKGFLKRGRFEVAPILALSLNDAYYQKIGGGLRLAYSLQDSFAVAVRGSYYTPFRTDNVLEGKVALRSQLLTSQLNGQAMLDGVWSPIYGKASFLADAIVHFDVFLAAGFGAVWSATSVAPRNEGPHPAAEVGGGIRFYPREWMAFELGLMATFYPDQPVVSVPATVQTLFVANVGISIFLPTRFEYVYPQ